MKYIFISGGVISGIGKGISTSSIALLLKSRGFTVAPIKCDPYINVDAGTMNPIEHGEVFVLNDGSETDQDLGNYERFLNQDLAKENFTTQGQVYLSVIQRERALEYEGKSVEMMQHIPEEIMNRIEGAGKKTKADIVIIEIGGTVGEYQNMMFLEANRRMKYKYGSDVLHIHVTYLPTPASLGEMKSKPAQMSVHLLNSFGIQPDFLLARSEHAIDDRRREKIAIMCSMDPESIIPAPDVKSVYEVPLNFEKAGLGDKLLKTLKIRKGTSTIGEWKSFVYKALNAKNEVKISIVGKYFSTGDYTLADSYVSVIESIKHAAYSQNLKPIISWIDSSKIMKEGVDILKTVDGVIVPGGFGGRDVAGKIMTAEFARTHKVPYFGLCYGMQMAVIEYARNVLHLKAAHTTEIEPKATNPVIHIMPEQEKKMLERDYGATMRLGAWECHLLPGTRTRKAYNADIISERHRHRFEFNNDYREQLEAAGLTVAGTSPDGHIVEIVEITDHPFFIGVQFHPELQSRPLAPHPLFSAFIKASYAQKQANNSTATANGQSKTRTKTTQQPVVIA